MTKANISLYEVRKLKQPQNLLLNELNGSRWIFMATRLFHLDPHHCFFQFFSFLICSKIYYFWQFFRSSTSVAIFRP